MSDSSPLAASTLREYVAFVSKSNPAAVVSTPVDGSNAKAEPVLPDKMLHASAVSADNVTVPTSVPTVTVSETENDWDPAIAKVRSLTVTDIVRSVVAESAESVALT